MKHVHHRTLSAACSLNVSILSDLPQNSDIESSEYKAEEKGKGRFTKVTNTKLSYIRSKSVFEGEQAGEEEEDAIKCSMLTDARMDYFRAIEKALLVENQNLKNHNSFLLEQIRKLYLRQKRMKQEAAAQQNVLKQIKKVNRELENTVQLLSNELMQQIRSLRFLLSEQQLDHTPTAGYRFKTFQGMDNAESVSLTLPESLQTMKYIFSKTDDESYNTHDSSSIYFPIINPENYHHQLQNPDLRKALLYTDNMRRKIGNSSSNHPILKDLDDKLNTLSSELAQRAKTAKKNNNFKKTRTLAN